MDRFSATERVNRQCGQIILWITNSLYLTGSPTGTLLPLPLKGEGTQNQYTENHFWPCKVQKTAFVVRDSEFKNFEPQEYCLSRFKHQSLKDTSPKDRVHVKASSQGWTSDGRETASLLTPQSDSQMGWGTSSSKKEHCLATELGFYPQVGLSDFRT